MAQKYFAIAPKVRRRQRSQVIIADDDGHAAIQFNECRLQNPALRELHHSVRHGERRLVTSAI